MTIPPRYLVLINLALLAAIAYVSSSIVGTAIAAKLTPPPAVHISEPPAPLAREPRKPAQYYSLIHTRDIFNSTHPEPEKPKGPPPKTELKVRLWGTAIHSDGNSSCIIEDLGTHQQGLYHIGDPVQGTATVRRVEWERVILSRDGQEEILELTSDAKKPANMVASAPPSGTSPSAIMPGSAPNAPGGKAAVDEHIQLTGDNQYLVDRSEVDSALENMNQLFTQIRAVPHFEGGRATGFRLFAIRQDSIFDKIGLKNGDIVQSINGQELSDPGRAMAMLTEFRNQPQVTVDVLRNKEPRTLTYQFR